ncbi:MAG: hypothetical protein AAF862_13590 [Pseudomonadota bacterium]
MRSSFRRWALGLAYEPGQDTLKQIVAARHQRVATAIAQCTPLLSDMSTKPL